MQTHELVEQLQVERLLDWRRAVILQVELDRRTGSIDSAASELESLWG